MGRIGLTAEETAAVRENAVPASTWLSVYHERQVALEGVFQGEAPSNVGVTWLLPRLTPLQNKA
jgi:hypothetical protein